MKGITPVQTGKLTGYFVAVEDEISDVQWHKVQGVDNSCITYFIKDLGTCMVYLNAPGSYTLLATTKEISKEQAGLICDQQRGGGKWKDYTVEGNSLGQYGCYFMSTAKHSLQSLIRSLGLNPDNNYAILKLNQ